MKNTLLISILILSLFFVGCANIPVKQQFPEVPEELLQETKKLETLDNDAKISDVLKTVVNNYGICNETTILLNGWQEWYKQQERIYKEVEGR